MGVVAVFVLELALDEDTGIVYFSFTLLFGRFLSNYDRTRREGGSLGFECVLVVGGRSIKKIQIFGGGREGW